MGRAKQLFSIPMANRKNRDDFPAYERSLEEQYLQTLLTNTLGNTFYAMGNELMAEADAVHDEMLTKDAEFAAKAIVFARTEGFIRLQPIYGLVKLSSVDPALFKKAFHQTIRIPSDLFDFLTILDSQKRGQGGRVIKREIATWLDHVSEYWAIKYNGRGRGFNLGDVIATTHPKPTTEKQQALFRYLMGKETDYALLPQIQAYEALKRAETETERVNLIRDGRLPHEVVTGVIKPTQVIWEMLMEQLPIFALLRNLNTLDRAGILQANLDYITIRLTDKEALQKSKILPFQFVNAFFAVENARVRDVLRQAVELTFDNLPNIPGKTAVFLDISGSMNGEYLRTGSVFALALFKKTRGNGLFWLFDTGVYDPNPSLHDSILSQAEKIQAQGGTNTGVPVAALTNRKEYVDNIIISTFSH